MATDKKKNFTNLLADVTTPSIAGNAPAAPVKPGKGPLLAFNIDDDLKLLLDRAVFWMGKGGSQRAFINQALREALAKNPDAEKPMPGE